MPVGKTSEYLIRKRNSKIKKEAQKIWEKANDGMEQQITPHALFFHSKDHRSHLTEMAPIIGSASA